MTYSGVGTAENARLTQNAAATIQNAAACRRWCRVCHPDPPVGIPGSAAVRSVRVVISSHPPLAFRRPLPSAGLTARIGDRIYHVQRKIVMRPMLDRN